MPKVSLSEMAADLSRLHNLLSMADGDPYEFNDLCFEAAIKRRLNTDPAQIRQLQRIATQVSLLVSD